MVNQSSDNGTRIRQFKADIHDCRQTESMSVMDYYSKLSQLWDDLDKYEPIITCKCRKCDCDIEKQHSARRDSERLHQFLLGLLPVPYGSLRSMLLSQNPLPTLPRAFHIISKEELARTESPPPCLRSIAGAEEEFANLEEKEQFVCKRYRTHLRRDWQMRKPVKWPGKQQKKIDKPIYCFAICHRPPLLHRKGEPSGDEEVEIPLLHRKGEPSGDEEVEIGKDVTVCIFILVPEICSIYHFANFIASTDGITCVANGAKIYVFGGGCGTRVWYRNVATNGCAQGKWKQAKKCLNREKHHPLSFSLGKKIYALETRYLQMSDGMIGKVDDAYCFEVLDTSIYGSCWRSLCNPPFPFGGCSVVNSWTSDGSGDQNDESRIFIEGCFDYTKYLFVYDVGVDTWAKFKQDCPLSLVEYPQICTGYRPFYTWALHLVGKDFAPFPPHVPYTGDLRVLTGLKRSIPQLHQLTSECPDGVRLPVPVQVETDRIEKVTVPCKKSSRCLTGWDLESLWTLHCLPVEKVIFWQAIHLGGSSFCTLAFYYHSSCCIQHKYLYARVANFDITCAAGGGDSEPVFSAEYGPNKVYLVSKNLDVSLLACSKLQPV